MSAPDLVRKALLAIGQPATAMHIAKQAGMTETRVHAAVVHSPDIRPLPGTWPRLYAVDGMQVTAKPREPENPAEFAIALPLDEKYRNYRWFFTSRGRRAM